MPDHTAEGFPYPMPTWTAVDLGVVFRTLSRGVKRALRDESFSQVPMLDWAEGLRAFDILHCGLHSLNHSFGHPAFDWVRLSEPQVTKAWLHFLTSDRVSRKVLRDRCHAFVSALIGSQAVDFPGPAADSSFKVATEVSFRVNGRSRSQDLLIEWRDGEGVEFAVGVEFKFGHSVTRRQLSDYRREMHRRFGGRANVRLVLVLADHGSYRSDGRRSKDWNVVKWETLLRRIDSSAADGEVEYARFRRTVWDRSLLHLRRT